MSDEDIAEVRGIDLLEACPKKRKRVPRRKKGAGATAADPETTKVVKDKDEFDLEDIVFGGDFGASESEDDSPAKDKVLLK